MEKVNKLVGVYANYYFVKGTSILHREDGASVEVHDGTKEWYFYGKKINCKNQEEFLRIIKLKAFL